MKVKERCGHIPPGKYGENHRKWDDTQRGFVSGRRDDGVPIPRDSDGCTGLHGDLYGVSRMCHCDRLMHAFDPHLTDSVVVLR